LVIVLYIFLYLQILDLLTTLVGFKLGISEASPAVRLLMHFGPSVAVIGLAGLCLSLKRSYLIRRINYWYAALVVWNLGIILSA
jgi:hypothetical protein